MSLRSLGVYDSIVFDNGYYSSNYSFEVIILGVGFFTDFFFFFTGCLDYFGIGDFYFYDFFLDGLGDCYIDSFVI
jgi:hypothetical protein